MHEKEARRLGFIAAYARGGDYQSSTCVVFTLFLNKAHWRGCRFGRLFGLWSRLGLVLYIHRQRKRQGAWDSSQHAQEAGIIRAAYAWYLHYFKQKNTSRRCCSAVCLFGLWSRSVLVRAVHTSAEKEARRLGFMAAYARGGDYRSSTCVVFALCSQPTLLFVCSAFVWCGGWWLWPCSVFGAVLYIYRERRAWDSSQYMQEAGIIRAAQHMRGVYIIFSTRSIGDVVVRPFVWRVAFWCRVRFWCWIYISSERGEAPGIHRSIRKRPEYQNSTCMVFALFS